MGKISPWMLPKWMDPDPMIPAFYVYLRPGRSYNKQSIQIDMVDYIIIIIKSTIFSSLTEYGYRIHLRNEIAI
jgi:hypothetical protein